MTSAPAADIAELKNILEGGPYQPMWTPGVQAYYAGLLADAYRAEIARLTRQRNEWNILGRSDWDSDADLKAQISDLKDELYDLEHPEAADPLPVETKEAA